MINLKAIIDNLPSAVIVVDVDRHVLMANKMAQVLSGEKEVGLVGMRPGGVMGCVHAGRSDRPGDCERACRFCAARQAIERSFEEKKDIAPFEALIETRQRGRAYLKFTVTYLQIPPDEAPQGAEVLAIVTVDDMTDYKEKQRLGAVMETVGTICHEMNQPLMVLAGQLDLLEMDIGCSPRVVTLKAQVDRMGSITRKLQSIKGYRTKPYPGCIRGILDTGGAGA